VLYSLKKPRHAVMSQMVNDTSTVLRDRSMWELVPEVCAHAWIDICVEGMNKTNDDPKILVHQFCGVCHHARAVRKYLRE